MSEETLVSIVDEAIHHAERLEEGLTIMVGIRDRSVGIALKRANYKIAALQNSIAVAEGRAVVASATLMELAGWKAHLSLEEYLDEEFKLLGVVPHVRHLYPICDVVGLPRAVTIASIDPINIESMQYAISAIEILYGRMGSKQSRSVSSFMKQQLEADGCAGIAVCDYRDQFSRKRGRLISKGRLLKALRNGGLRR